MPEPRTILVVDDEPVLLDSLADILQLEGFSVLKASNGLEALDLLQDQTPHLILTDIMMPGMNGYQLYQRVRKNPEWLWIPFIFLTAKGEAEDIRFGKELGADDYLMKPILPEDLVAAVIGRLERYRQLEARPQAADQPYKVV
jgi:DNA-binding response OmpR family regulator